MKKCRDDHGNSFYFHGLYQHDGKIVVIAENIKSRRLAILCPTDITFLGIPAPIPPLRSMFCDASVDAALMPDLSAMSFAPLKPGILHDRDTEPETSIEGEVHGALGEAFPGEEAAQ